VYGAGLTTLKARMFCLQHETTVCLMDDFSIDSVLVMCYFYFQLPGILEGTDEYVVPHPLMPSFSIERKWEQASFYV